MNDSRTVKDQNDSSTVKDRELERQGRRLTAPSPWLLLVGAVTGIVGVVFVIIGTGFLFGLGLALLVIAGGPTVVGLGLLLAGLVSRWAARHRLFA
jgi:hypothetical protein